jgi:hypothetical protein
MKAGQLDDHAHTETVSTDYVTWNKDARAQLLRVELSNGDFFLFPYGHLGVVGFKRRGNEDVLTLCFAGHDIEITGKHLRELGLAFQKLAVDWVRELPARYTATARGDGAYVARIKVSEAGGVQ